MIDIIISIGLYIIAAILLGFTFGWFIAKAIFKEKFEEQVEALSTNYDANRNTLELDSKAHDKKLSELKDKIRSLKLEHEKEIDAFLDERIDITQKYKELLARAV